MSADRRVEIFSRLPESERTALSSRLDPAAWASLQRMLAYPPKSAGRIMTTEFVTVPATCTIEQAVQHIREIGGEKESAYALYVVDPTSSRLLRTISLGQLILADHNMLVSDVGSFRRSITVSPFADREQVARLISKYDLLAVPVVDDLLHPRRAQARLVLPSKPYGAASSGQPCANNRRSCPQQRSHSSGTQPTVSIYGRACRIATKAKGVAGKVTAFEAKPPSLRNTAEYYDRAEGRKCHRPSSDLGLNSRKQPAPSTLVRA
jgi:CBS domain-containing protein